MSKKSKPKKTELAKMKALSDLGYSPHAIAKRTDRDPKTVRKYLNSEAINDPDIQVIVQKIKDAELNDLLLLNQKARANLHKRFDEGSPNVIESTAVMDRTFGQIRLLQNQSTQNISVSQILQVKRELEAKRKLEAKRDAPEIPEEGKKEGV